MRTRLQRGFTRKPGAADKESAFADQPFAVPRSRTTEPSIQRYTVVNPENYQQAAVRPAQLFPSQKLDTSRTSEIVYSHQHITQRLSWIQQYTRNPPLKISEHGSLALESTVGQPKVFYGAADQIETSRKRLIDIGSRITLKTNSSERLRVPRNPANIDANTNTLVQVEPARSPRIDHQEPLMNANECDAVSQSIVHGKEVAIGNAVDGVALAGEVSAQFGEIHNVAKAIGQTQLVDPVGAFPGRVQQADQSRPSVYNAQLPISTEVTKYFANGLFRRKHLIPHDQVLRALSLPGVPKKVWEQVYELHVGKDENERPDRWDLLTHIENILKFQQVRSYEQVRNNQALNTKLGVNEFAQPEVGESFSTLSQFSPPVVDEVGSMTGELSIANLGPNASGQIYNEMLSLRSRANLLGTVASGQHRRARGLVPFQEHHASVVARDGGDSVTFENYNRGAEEDILKVDLWDQLFEEFSGFDKNINRDLKNIREAVQSEKDKTDQSPPAKMVAIINLRKRHLDVLRQKFMIVQSFVGLKVETNLGQNKNDLWHFNMYGPAQATYVDAEGNQKPQSFHETWSPAIPNAITVRTTAKADPFFLRDKKAELGPRIARAAYRDLKQSGFADSKEEYQQRLAGLRSTLFNPIEAARTRVEASIAYQSALEQIDEHEDGAEPLTAREVHEADVLAAGDVSKARLIVMQIVHESKMEADRLQFNRNSALSLLPRQPQLGRKYALWSLENRQRIGALDAKRRFFLAFAS